MAGASQSAGGDGGIVHRDVPSPAAVETATAVGDALVKVVGVRFRQAGKVYYFDPGDEDYTPGDRVIVETSEGREVGEVAIRSKPVPVATVVLPLRPVIRRVEPTDDERLARGRELEREGLRLALERVRAHGLPMKLVTAEAGFDGDRLRLFFVADQRVDFRALVRDLAGKLRVRIELRQIGVRDQAKILGGIGDCGRELCCTTWMGDFEPVSIRMAKLQNLSLNPSRLSGQCGRLKCCLKYENDTYRDILRELPKVGSIVGTPRGRGKVAELLVLKESVLVDLGDGRRVEVRASELIDPEAAPEIALEEPDYGNAAEYGNAGGRGRAGVDAGPPHTDGGFADDGFADDVAVSSDGPLRVETGVEDTSVTVDDSPGERAPEPASEKRGRRRRRRGGGGSTQREGGQAAAAAQGRPSGSPQNGAAANDGGRARRPGKGDRRRRRQEGAPPPPPAGGDAGDKIPEAVAAPSSGQGAPSRRRRRRRRKGPKPDESA